MRQLCHPVLAGIVLLTAGLVFATASPEARSQAEASLFDLSETIELYETSPRAESIRLAAEGSITPYTDPLMVQMVVEQSHERGFSAEEVLVLLERTERLAKADLPVTPVLSRYLEGMAKGIPFPHINQVSDQMETLLGEAGREVDGRYPSPADGMAKQARLAMIDHGAYVLNLGVTSDMLDDSYAISRGEARPHDEGVAPVLTLGILVDSGVTPNKSLQVVEMAWRHGYRGDALERLGIGLGRVAQDPGVVDEVMEMIDDGASQDRVFQGLDELVGRGDDVLRLSGPGPTQDPSTRRGTGRTGDEPTNQPRRQQEIPTTRGGGV